MCSLVFQMEISRKFLLICALWCSLDYVHSLSSSVNTANSTAINCGLSQKFSKFSRIVAPAGNAGLADWPWIGAMFNYNYKTGQYEFGCGSSLISDRWVLTAAHCVEPQIDRKLHLIRFGAVNNRLNVQDMRRKVSTDSIVDRIIQYPGYRSHPLNNDIALIRLKEPVPFSNYVRPVCLPSSAQKGSNEYTGATVYITGWGASNARGYSPYLLKDSFLKVANREMCARVYAENRFGPTIDKSVICAGGTRSTTCYGDSGGPLTLLNKDDSRLYLVGIVSTGDRCSPRLPAVFTRTAHFMGWINNTIRANQ